MSKTELADFDPDQRVYLIIDQVSSQETLDIIDFYADPLEQDDEQDEDDKERDDEENDEDQGEEHVEDLRPRMSIIAILN